MQKIAILILTIVAVLSIFAYLFEAKILSITYSVAAPLLFVSLLALRGTRSWQLICGGIALGVALLASIPIVTA